MGRPPSRGGLSLPLTHQWSVVLALADYCCSRQSPSIHSLLYGTSPLNNSSFSCRGNKNWIVMHSSRGNLPNRTPNFRHLDRELLQLPHCHLNKEGMRRSNEFSGRNSRQMTGAGTQCPRSGQRSLALTLLFSPLTRPKRSQPLWNGGVSLESLHGQLIAEGPPRKLERRAAGANAVQSTITTTMR